MEPLSFELQIRQSLYSGGGTVSGVKQAESAVEVSLQNLRSVEQSVLQTGIVAYVDVLQDIARVDLTHNNENVLKRQLEASKDRFQVGEITRTDVAQSEARLSRAVSERISTEGDLAQSRASYFRVIGRQADNLRGAPDLPNLLETLAASVSVGMKSNPAILSALAAEKTAGHAIRVAEADLYPSIDLVGTVSRNEDVSLPGRNSRSDSIIAQLTIPLYQAGFVHSRVREAKLLRNQRRIEVENRRQQILESVTRAWEALIARRAEIRSRAEEVRANQIALEGVRQEAEVGSRTTLDVLNAEQELLDARVALVIANRNEYVARVQLLSSIGKLTARDLKLPVQYYDPSVHADEVREKWWGTDPSVK